MLTRAAFETARSNKIAAVAVGIRLAHKNRRRTPNTNNENGPKRAKPMLVDVLWTELDDGDPLWSGNFCLYAYLHAQRDWLLYVGKADYSSVR